MSAIISPCGKYRYTLHREVCANPFITTRACVVMVNPSTADAINNDRTIGKLIGFGQRLAWSDFIVVNKFAYRATDVNEVRNAADPIGPLNDGYIIDAMMQADIVVVAWGRLKKLPVPLWQRWRRIVMFADRIGKPLHSWGTCDDGHPCHPVMLGYDTPLVPWTPPL